MALLRVTPRALRPAHFCGVYGLKTSEHRVPRAVRIMGGTGPLARDLDVAPVPLVAERRVSVAELRLAVAPTLPGIEVAHDIQRQVERVTTTAAYASLARRLPQIDWGGQLRLYGDLVGTVTGVFAGRGHDGLPIGIQIVGPRWSEMRLLAIARALEEAGILPGFQPPPGF